MALYVAPPFLGRWNRTCAHRCRPEESRRSGVHPSGAVGPRGQRPSRTLLMAAVATSGSGESTSNSCDKDERSPEPSPWCVPMEFDVRPPGKDRCPTRR
jgi:hypothetical protein